MLPGPDERLLGDVLGGPVVGDDRAGQTEDATLEAPDERRRGVRSPAASPATSASSETVHKQ